MPPKAKKKSDSSKYEIKVIDTDKKNIPQRAIAKSGVLPKFPFSMVICGSSGSGKTNLLMNILTRKEIYGGYYHTIIVMSPTAGSLDDVYSSLKIPEENFLKEFDKTIFDKIIEARKDMIMKKGIESVARSERCLIILDDIISERSFLQSSEALKMFTLLRHYLCSVVMLTQSYTKVPRALRLNAMCTFLFPSTRSEVEIMKDEICPPSLTKQDFQRVIEYCTSGRYDFLTYNRHADPDERIRKNLTEIVDLEKFKTKDNRSDYRKNKNLDEDKEKDEKY